MWWRCSCLCLWHKNQPSLPTPFYSVLVSVSDFMALSTVFHSTSSPQQLSAFSLCSSDVFSALIVLSTIYLFMKVSLSPDIILCGWLGLKYRLTNWQQNGQFPQQCRTAIYFLHLARNLPLAKWTGETTVCIKPLRESKNTPQRLCTKMNCRKFDIIYILPSSHSMF